MSEVVSGRPMRRLRARLLLIACLAAIGCGSNASTEREKAKASVETFLTACSHERPLVAEGVLSGPTRERFVNGEDTLEGCKRVLGLSLAGVPPEAAKEALRRAEVRIEQIDGGFATALVKSPPSRRATVELENLNTLGTEWRIYDPRPTPPAGRPAPSEDAEPQAPG